MPTLVWEHKHHVSKYAMGNDIVSGRAALPTDTDTRTLEPPRGKHR